ncbi:unnamed protein product [Urochloa decumbens]|uniref:Uncharacterized protein n=1 Tax=Urochloa decumbens TaxID=240449 RepID=A0ABC9BLM0_9POAL
MEGPLVSVSMGVMKRLLVLAKLTKLLEEEYDKLRGVSKQIKSLTKELRAMSPALEMLGDAQKLSPLTRYWRDELRELAYDMEDCIDNFMAHADHEDGKPTGFLWSKRVMEVSERHQRYNFVELTSNTTPSAVDPRLPALYEEIDRLVGIGGPKKRVIELLDVEINGPSAELVRVVSIVGCGGLGKTTLANQVYHTIKSKFACTAFVSVSRTPDIRKILRGIVKEVGVTADTLDDDERQLCNKLREHLKDKRYFVVIDDAWDTKAWEFIKLALPDNDNGSRIITTTRSVTVAKYCSSQDRYVYELVPLSFDDSKRLFFKRVFGSENSWYPHLEDVSNSILRKCGGLPLAIITVSSMLTNKYAKAEWDRVQTAIGIALTENPEAEKMASILSLSYFDIPNHLKTCLLYLSVFPEDYRIEKHYLINRWIAEGFIQEKQGENAYEIGECYFNDLINRSMIQPVDVKYDQAKACRVHDIILDYIKCKASEENFATSLNAAENVHTSEYKVRRLCVININEQHFTLWANWILSHVRSVTISRDSVQTSLLPFTVLRVLDLGNCIYMEDHHFTCIEKMFHLKYLRLGSNSITKLPEKIGELRYMQTLDLRGTRIKDVPPTITKLQRLAHLYVGWNVTFPDGTIGHMHSLEELRTCGVQSYEQGKPLRELFKLTKLRTLKIKWDFDWTDGLEGIRQIQDIHSYVGTLLSTCSLYNLSISDKSDWIYPLSLDSWHPAAPCSLRKLRMKGCLICKLPKWMGSLKNLEVLEIGIIFCVRPEDVEILGAIPSLLYLELVTAGGTNGRIVVQCNNGFRSLKYFSLFIWACGTALEFEAGSMPRLEHLKLEFLAHTMECLNGASDMGVQNLSSLSKVEVKIRGDCMCDSKYDPTEDMDDDSVGGYIARAINGAVETLSNCPTIRFETEAHAVCEHFESVSSKFQCVRKHNKHHGGVMNKWFQILQVEEGQTDQPTDGETNKQESMTISRTANIDLTPLKNAGTGTSSLFPTFKVRRKKVRDDIMNELRQLVAPFGRSDSASVLHETIEYIKFLHVQVDSLSAPYLKSRQQVPYLKVSGDGGEAAAVKEDLTGRGLCLVPTSSTFEVPSKTPVAFWTPFGEAFR